MSTNPQPPTDPAAGRPPDRRFSFKGAATVVLLLAIGVLFLPGPDIWRYLGGTLFVVAAAVLVIGMDR